METFKLARDIPVLDGYDVLVAGGGPAGSAAAVSAARLGARVLLVEASGCLGGMGTAGLVANFAPMSDGVRPLVGGFTRELIETLHARDRAISATSEPIIHSFLQNVLLPLFPEERHPDFCPNHSGLTGTIADSSRCSRTSAVSS